MTINKQKVVLCILDGWGMSDDSQNNGIALAPTPNWDQLCQVWPLTTLQASELNVGLPIGQMGNSEVGHMTIGSGRVIMQDLPRIDQAIASQSIPYMPAFQKFVEDALKGTGVVHLLGLLSPGGVHSHQHHIFYFANVLADLGLRVKIHAFLDGRDTPPQSAIASVRELQTHLNTQISLATITGRYFAMDRDKRWDRILEAYNTIVHAEGSQTSDAVAAIEQSYSQGIHDEFIHPHCLSNYAGIADGDSLFMVNFRADRVRQILNALCDPEFREFERHHLPKFAALMGTMEYSEKLKPLIPALFIKEAMHNTLGEVVAGANLKQLRTAETEKYAHVTFFFNGGRELVFPGEDRHLVKSPAVATYDLQPEMSAPELTKNLVQALASQKYNLVVVNYANPDMVGHTGVQSAIIKAVTCVDDCLGQLQASCRENGYVLIITADHGNVEMMVDAEQDQPHTAHTLNPVPFVVANFKKTPLRTGGSLSDIAPTILAIMGLAKPDEMTGQSLLDENAEKGYGHTAA